MAQVASGASADLIRITSAFPASPIEAAAHQARILLRLHDLKSANAAGIRHLSGDAVIVETAEIDAAVQLLLSDIRKRVTRRIILVVAQASAEARILVRTLGTDHVVDVSVDPRELAAILGNAIRASRRSHQALPRAGEHHHRWSLETDRWVLIAPNDREVRLTRSEYSALLLLLAGAGVIQSREALIAAISGGAGRRRVLDVLLSKLRRKVWECAGIELPLRSARNAGYVFAGVAGLPVYRPRDNFQATLSCQPLS